MYAMASGLSSGAASSVEAAARASIAAYRSVLGRPLTAAAVETLIGALR